MYHFSLYISESVLKTQPVRKNHTFNEIFQNGPFCELTQNVQIIPTTKLRNLRAEILVNSLIFLQAIKTEI
jgi:hypothetical protein